MSLPPPPWAEESQPGLWWRGDAVLEPAEPRWCPRCGYWYRADSYVEHAWTEKP